MDKPQIELIPIKKLRISIWNIRHSNLEEGLDALAESIATIGLLQPIVVTSRKDGYEVIMGQRRFFGICQTLQRNGRPQMGENPCDYF